MVLGDKKLFDIFIGKQLRHYLEDKDRMALARQFGITRQEYEAPPGTVKWLQGRGQVAIRGPPRGPPPTLLAMSHPRMHYVVCHYCHSQGHPHPDYPDLPEEHRPGCPCLRPPRRHGPRRGGEYPYRRTRRRGRRPAHHPYDTDLDDDIDMFTEFEEDMESDFGDLDDFEEDIDDGGEDLDDDYTHRSRRSYTRARPDHHYPDPRRPRDPRGYPRGRGHHGGRRVEAMYPPGRYPGYGHRGPMMMGGGHRSPDRYGPEDDSSAVTW